MEKKKKHIAILGSTGSIGTQALEVMREQRNLFEVEVLTAGSNADLLIEQAIEFQPNAVVISDATKYNQVKEALKLHAIKVYSGNEAIEQVVQMDTIDMVLTAMVGFSGLKPTIAAIKAKKHIALANKETLVVAGSIISELAIENRVEIIPVDSEHSAIFQCLVGEPLDQIEKVILTASGGPFRGKDRAFLAAVSKAQALKHPNWTMGAKITIDSATLMNKGLEYIEAKWLFGLKNEQIDIIVHPQSIIHSLVQFVDGSLKAQLGLPDMKLPIQYALGFPQRLKNDFPRFDFANFPSLNFEKPDYHTFTNLQLAIDACAKGGNAACVLNAANEVVVAAFLEDKIGFIQMSDIIGECLQQAAFKLLPSLDDLYQTDAEARILASELCLSDRNRK
ncbi:MAG: 1-deoxy-D-xylulose-5-phosphate reductoisomerase [Bacteroidota bacterium]|nr:1-deoxy-D-xylulose-5-phosphate reductoisomerase [Bacteroidota bacterium]